MVDGFANATARQASFANAGTGERTRPEQGLSDKAHGHDRGFETRKRVTKESNAVQHCVIDAICCRLVELLVVAAKHCPVELTWIEACQVTLTVIRREDKDRALSGLREGRGHLIVVRLQKVDALLLEVWQQRRKNVARPDVFDASDGLAA